MATGPLRRLIGLLGLLALTPTMALLAIGQISPVQAALRATVTLIIALLVGRMAAMSIGFYLRLAESGQLSEVPAAVTPERRAGDGE